MAIEGPLKELGIHDVFQLLDLSRKTGILRVTSELRDNEGRVWFNTGAILFAQLRSNPHPLGEMLMRAGKITEADLQRARDTNVTARKVGDLSINYRSAEADNVGNISSQGLPLVSQRILRTYQRTAVL